MLDSVLHLLYTLGMVNEAQAPTGKEVLNVRNLPKWAAAAHRRKAERNGVSYSDQVRAVLCASALGIIAAEQRAEAAPAAQPEGN